MLICPVRNCGAALTRSDRQYTCPQRHSFDVARSGYINLLQPQDKRSREPGDTAAAVQARRRLHDRGFTAPLRDAIGHLAAVTPRDTVLDVGCGEGFYLSSLGATTAVGTDLSIPAIDAAARRYPDILWVVANADRALPLATASFTLITSITARMNPPEFARLLAPGGRLLVAIPAPTDLIEIRGVGRDRRERTIADFAPHFKLVASSQVTHTTPLDEAAIADIRHAIYRPLHSEPIVAREITFSLDLLLFAIL